jgi:Tfp pilus assembly protein FimT
MKGARAFTIVEFTIAIAVATIIGLAAITRYNTYLRHQEFIAGGQQIANCLQRANQQARASSALNPPRFIRATINQVTSDSSVTCAIEQYQQKTAAGVDITTTNLLGGNPAETGTTQTFRAENAALSTGTTVRFVFGSLENGAPLGMSLDGSPSRQPDNSTVPSTYVPFGRGFSLDATTNRVELIGISTSACGVLSMPLTGTPVTFTELTSCP